MLTRRKMLVAKIENTYGAGTTASDATAFPVSDISRSPYEGSTQERQRMRQSLGANAQVNVGPYATVTVTVPLAGSGEPGVAPCYGILLRACGLSETSDTANGKVTYQPVSQDFESIELWYIYDGEAQHLTGARGTVTMNCTTGQFPTLEFTFTGFYERPKEAPTVDTAVQNFAQEAPVNNQNTQTFTVHGYAGAAQSITLDVGNTVTYQNLIGKEEVYITERAASGQAQFEAPRIGTHDYFAALESHKGITLGEIHFVHGTEDGNIVEFAAPRSQLSTISDQDVDGIMHYQMNARYLASDAGDDEFTLTFR